MDAHRADGPMGSLVCFGMCARVAGQLCSILVPARLERIAAWHWLDIIDASAVCSVGYSLFLFGFAETY